MRKLTVTDSSNVRSITFHEAGSPEASPENAALDVEFASGASYRYSDCTFRMFAQACATASVGRWVQQNLVVKKDMHRACKIADRPTPAVDGKLVALQVIASLPNPRADQVSLVRAARAALDGAEPPPLPVELERPTARALTRHVLWSPPPAPLTMQPDEARGLATALLVAALEAES